jgi:hypothetical protein
MDLMPLFELVKNAKQLPDGSLLLMEAPGEGKRIFVNDEFLVGVQEFDATKDERN